MRKKTAQLRPQSSNLTYFVVNFVIALAVLTRGDFSLSHQDPIPIWNQADQFFWRQLQALLDGRLWVMPSQLKGECFFHDGHCFSYFGLTPSIIRLPFLPLLTAFDTAGTAYFTAVAVGLSALAFWLIANDLAKEALSNSLLLKTCVALFLGPFSVLFFLSRTSIYHEALAWTLCFASFSIRYFVRWLKLGSRVDYLLLLIAAVFSAGVQPSIIPVLFVMAIGYAVIARMDGVALYSIVKKVIPLISMPILVCFGTLAIKFGTPAFDGTLHQDIPETPYWTKVLAINGHQLTSLDFIPTQLFSSFRPDGLIFSKTSPWIDLRFPFHQSIQYLPPVKIGGMAPAGAPSGISIFPAQFLFFLASIALVGRKIRNRRWLAIHLKNVVTLLACSAFLLLSAMQVQIASRYLAYYYLPVSFSVIFVLTLYQLADKQSFLDLFIKGFSLVGTLWTFFCLYNLYIGGT